MDELMIMSEEEFRHLLYDNSVNSRYSNNEILRALVQMIPTVGPLLDAVIALPGTKQKEERLGFLL